MQSPLISIITVVYNEAKTLEQTILSVLSQSYPRKEYIIIDGGSTDGSVEIIQKYAPQLAYWVSEPDKGVFDAMNKGISHATGDLIGIMNANDWFEAEVFTTIANHYQQIGSDKIIHGLLRNFEEEEFYSMIGNSIRRLRHDAIQHSTCFIPLKYYLEYGAYDTKYRYAADYDLTIRYVNAGVKFSFIEVPISNFRLGGISSSAQSEKEMIRVKMSHGFLSKTDGLLRILKVNLAHLLKKLLSH